MYVLAHYILYLDVRCLQSRVFIVNCSYRLTLEDRIATLESKSEAIQRNSAFGAKEMRFIPSSVSNSPHTTHTV